MEHLVLTYSFYAHRPCGFLLVPRLQENLEKARSLWFIGRKISMKNNIWLLREAVEKGEGGNVP